MRVLLTTLLMLCAGPVGAQPRARAAVAPTPVSYTHLTLPTSDLV